MKKVLTVFAVGCIVIGVIAMSSAFGRGSFHHFSLGATSERGSGKLVTETRTVDPFDKVETNLGVDVVVHVGAPQKLTVTIDDNLMDNLATEVHGKTLRVTSRHSFSTHHNCSIEIWVPSLVAFTSNGSGDIQIYDLKGDDFSYQLSGSGDFKAFGDIDHLNIELNGSGNVDTRKLTAQSVDVSINGSGSATVAAKSSLDVEINGSGDVSYIGSPEHIRHNIYGSGSLEKLGSL